ncbi:MAG TPA: prenyltransferase/squalene oxidase repeat-containing protein [Planctomycetota bacterium]|nr:prenyltransferase/squalene oxidase repeat-containing protein [Planctomycetota bacterium]
MSRAIVSVLILACALPVRPQARKPEEARVEDAIRRGVEWLKGAGGRDRERELVLLAMVHSGVRATDPSFGPLLQSMLEGELRSTYRVSLQAMVLEELDRVKYQKRIFQCAQFLVDNQAGNGLWSYGQPTSHPEPSIPPVKDVPTGAGTGKIHPGQVVMFGNPSGGGKPAVRQRIPVKQQRVLNGGGDNSNAQYAALGLRACHDAGIMLPREVVEKARKWWLDSQCGSGGASTAGRGWNYGRGGTAYGSMTAGAVGALTICDHILGIDWRKDDAANAGVHWLRENFSVIENPGRQAHHHYYYLYGLERAGMLYGTETFGKREWYPEGAAYLLERQRADGSWGDPVDTCFAILFLRRATHALVESRDSTKPKK